MFRSCHVDLKPSRLALVWLCLLFAATLVALASGRWPWWCLILILPWSIWLVWRQWQWQQQRWPSAVAAVLVGRGGWQLQDAAGRWRPVHPDPTPWVARWLLVLHLRSQATGARWLCVVWRDAVPAADWAALRRCALRPDADRI